jgi:maleylpyruvate isomerase
LALAIKGLSAEQVTYRLREGDQLTDGYRRLNPQALVPALITDSGAVLTQSLAICEYLEECFPEPPLLPAEPLQRARVRAAAQLIACDVHPLQNLKVLERLRALGHDEAVVKQWAMTVIDEGLSAFEALVADQPGPFAFGDRPTLADICLVPQLGNARRFGVDLKWPRIQEIERACEQLEAFRISAPSAQPDAV